MSTQINERRPVNNETDGRSEPEEKKKSPEGASQDQEPGFSQKTNQNQQKEDPLAS